MIFNVATVFQSSKPVVSQVSSIWFCSSIRYLSYRIFTYTRSISV